jgi:hypothetical protein
MEALSDREAEALAEALDDEYQAWATYDQVIADFGAVRPFVNIREAEARHIEALAALYRRYGLVLPPNRWPGRVPRYPDVRTACAAGEAAEIANAALYERLLAATTRADLIEVFTRLRRASQERHLPAFRRCAQRRGDGTGGGGRGRCHGGRD